MRLFIVALLGLLLAGCTTTGGFKPPSKASLAIACNSVTPTYNAVMIAVDGGVITRQRDIDAIKEIHLLVTDACTRGQAAEEGDTAAFYAIVTTAGARLLVIAARYGKG